MSLFCCPPSFNTLPDYLVHNVEHPHYIVPNAEYVLLSVLTPSENCSITLSLITYVGVLYNSAPHTRTIILDSYQIWLAAGANGAGSATHKQQPDITREQGRTAQHKNRVCCCVHRSFHLLILPPGIAMAYLVEARSCSHKDQLWVLGDRSAS